MMYFSWRDGDIELAKRLADRLVKVSYSDWELESHDDRDMFYTLLGSLWVGLEVGSVRSLYINVGRDRYAINLDLGSAFMQKLERYFQGMREYQYEHHRGRVIEVLKGALEEI